jgi:cytochrome o ubiquinol oxidase subunit 3
MKEHQRTEEKVTFGFWLYLMSDCVLFAVLFATFAVLAGATAYGPSMADVVNLPFVLKETLILLTSTFTIGCALLAARARQRTLTMLLLAATFALGAAFLTMEVSEFMYLLAQGEGPTRSAFLSAFFTIIGTHGLHVAAGMLWMLLIGVHIAIYGLVSGTVRKLACLALFWHFLDIIWVFIFTFVYLIGAIGI